MTEGLEDVSISRDKKSLTWGIAVPGDKDQVMYVWFEAVINYITALVDDESIDKWLEIEEIREDTEAQILDQIRQQMPINFHYLGKDIAKFHLVIWIAMLVALELPLTEVSYVHGFINDGEGRKFSKSLGNGVLPGELIERFGVEGARFVMFYEINQGDDTNFDLVKSSIDYNTNLADKLGNLLMRVTTLIAKHLDGIIDIDYLAVNPSAEQDLVIDLKDCYGYLENFEVNKSIKELFIQVAKLNQYLEQTKPWTLAKDFEKNRDEITKILTLTATQTIEVAKALSIFMPATGEKIYEILNDERVVKAKPLFTKIKLES